jgi:hypothetical protein
MSKALLVALVLALAAPTAFAQRMPEQRISQDAMGNKGDAGWSNHQTWLKSMANLTKFRAKLAEAWQGMGMPPQAAKAVADAYDPERAARMPHVSLRGKSDQEVAQLMQAALKEQRYMAADQLLIDYLSRTPHSGK